jgi:hypothetical protein
MSTAGEREKVIAAVPVVSEGLGDAGEKVSAKGKVKSLRLSRHHASILEPPAADATPSERYAWSFRNAIDLATDVRVELANGAVFRWMADPDLDGYEIATRVQMISLIREAFLANRSVIIHGIVELIPTSGRLGSELSINRVQAVEVVGVNI